MTYDFLAYIAILEFVIIAYLAFIAFRLKKLCNMFAGVICEMSDILSNAIKRVKDTCKK